MQTIARANRVFPGKHSGMIVDYANVFASLEKALAIYGAGKDGKNPVRDKQKLVEELRKAVDAAVLFCANRGVILAAIEQLPTGSMERLQRMDEAVNALISPDPLRREFFGHERLVSTLYGAVKPRPGGVGIRGSRGLRRRYRGRHPHETQSEPGGHLRCDGGHQPVARRLDHGRWHARQARAGDGPLED
jgi:type I restriction enzyme R subunit